MNDELEPLGTGPCVVEWEPSPYVRLVLAVLAIFAIFGALVGVIVAMIQPAEGAFVAVLSLSAAVLSVRARNVKREQGRVELTAEGICVHVRKTKAFARGDFIRGHLLRGPGAGVVVLERAWGARVHLEVTGELASERVLEHLGFTADSFLSVPILGHAGHGALTALVFFLVVVLAVPLDPVLPKNGFLGMVGVAFVIAALFHRRFRDPRLVVGVDGVRIVGVLRPRFFPFARMLDAQLTQGQEFPAIVLRARDGAGVRARLVPLRGQSRETILDVFTRVEAGLARSRESRPLAALAREGRPLAAWRGELSRLLTAGTFRQQPVVLEDVEAVLRDGQATREERIGAALALRDAERSAASPRIRLAAQECADEALRVALESLAKDEEVDEAAIEEALAAR